MTLAINVDSFFIESRGYALESDALASIGVKLELLTLPTEDQLIRSAAEADILLVEHPNTPLTRHVIETLPRIRMIAKYGVGLDNIDLEAASDRDIVVCHSPDYCIEEVSDHALSLILACARRTFLMDRHVRSGGWHDISFQYPIHRFCEQTVGLVGFGRIARRLADKLRGWRVRVIAYDPNVAPEIFVAHSVEPVSFASLLEQSDYLSLHLPLTDATHHLLDSDVLSQMRCTSFLINTSRGAIVDEAALINALSCGQLQGAALDVTEEEPLPPGHVLRKLPNVLITPHFGARSVEAMHHLRRTIIRSVGAFVAGFSPPFVANPKCKAALNLSPYHLWPGADNHP